MATFRCSVTTWAAAFDPYPEHEIARLLRNLAEVVADRGAAIEDPGEGWLLDSNGNRALHWEVTE